MSKQPYPYDEDEFDRLGANRVPIGVHREPVHWWRRALPFVVVLIVAPLLAFGVVQLWSQGTPQAGPAGTDQSSVEADAEGGSAPSESAQQSDSPTAEESEETPAEESSPTPSEEESTEPELNYDLGVWVLNGAGVTGLAGQTSAQLQDAGWHNVTAANYSSELPTTSAIYYTNSEMAEEAEAIGAELGISALHEDADAATNGVVIVLRMDFAQ
ncbi:MAG TPA: LytR C-terminal domain-containing protein [Beutenbergiaceae bacterium]|nr:LytR C-terminal domain-containing protein [Beutenbergiaceae bacterium]